MGEYNGGVRDFNQPSVLSRERQARGTILAFRQRRPNRERQIEAHRVEVIRCVAPLPQPVKAGSGSTPLFGSEMVPQTAMVVRVAARIKLQVIVGVGAGIAESRVVSPAERGA